MILLWGLPDEGPLAAVRAALERQCTPYHLLDQRQTLTTEIDMRVERSVTGTLRINDQQIRLEAVTALYLRPYSSVQMRAVAEAGPESVAWRHALGLEHLLWTWAEVTPALVVNRASAMATNDSKPHQLQSIRRHGFAVPETLLTTDPDAAGAFWERHGEVIYKSVSGIRSRVSRLTPEHRQRLAQVASCPTQFQRHIPGTDCRVHVVGSDLFACEIVSGADDYRYADGGPIEIRAVTLPEEIAERCRRLAADLGLAVAGIDLRRTPEGEWYCFEVNPSPAFTYYEQACGLPISDAVARLLASAPCAEPVEPLVSCIMPTANRRAFVPTAIHHFLRQDYPNRELIVVDDGDDTVADLIPDDKRIRYLRLPGHQTVGAKRNRACNDARGAIIAHWDDDDWHAPDRLRRQVIALRESGAEVCGIREALFYEPAAQRAWRYAYPPDQRFWLSGSTLCYTRAYWQAHPFPEINVGEDAAFVWAGQPERMAVMDDPTFHVGIIHSSNISPKQTDGSYWRPYPVAEIRSLMARAETAA